MNCKECLHFDVCAKAKNLENYSLRKCKDFKDRETIDKELDEMIDWCRNKLDSEKKKPIGIRLTSKQLDGYERAIKVVMSYLHSKKGG